MFSLFADFPVIWGVTPKLDTATIPQPEVDSGQSGYVVVGLVKKPVPGPTRNIV